ncbi:glycine zipper domain-containing protein [Magnetococcus sp. PR-3]|uniref:glycine zipper domain-containing protein n=1 Tax=Magnetococcus sp. PR-3 TaxID=3120355 RepID=UPI002FCE6075
MKRVTKQATVLMLASTLALAGCQTTGAGGAGPSDGSEKAPSNTQATKEGAIGGALLGALIGGLAKGKKGALIGALAGAAIGGVIGNEIDKRKQSFASTEAFYNAQIEQTQGLNAALDANNSNLKAAIAADEAEIDQLVAQAKSGKANTVQLQAKKSDLDTRLASNKKKLASLNKELEVQQAVLQEVQTAQQGSTTHNNMAKQVAALESEITELNGMVDAMATQSATVGQYL